MIKFVLKYTFFLKLYVKPTHPKQILIFENFFTYRTLKIFKTFDDTDKRIENSFYNVLNNKNERMFYADVTFSELVAHFKKNLWSIIIEYSNNVIVKITLSAYFRYFYIFTF